ncbi:MAG: addiction module protein [Thermoanaerobaculia bacterium]|nr:addiction module protein [Thermoanaerobaculia bacterium]
MTRFRAIENEALALEPEKRRALVESLRASLDSADAIEEAWVEEVERRIADVESGAVQLIPMDIALAQVRAKIHR